MATSRILLDITNNTDDNSPPSAKRSRTNVAAVRCVTIGSSSEEEEEIDTKHAHVVAVKEEANDVAETEGEDDVAVKEEEDDVAVKEEEDDDSIYERLLADKLKAIDEEQRTIASSEGGGKRSWEVESNASSVTTDHADPKPDDYLYCDTCRAWVVDMCVLHETNMVEVADDADVVRITVGDTTLPPLPSGLTYRLSSSVDCSGVFAERSFPRGTLFGVWRGDSQRAPSSTSITSIPYLWEVRLFDGSSNFLLADAKHGDANWLTRIRSTGRRAQQNLVAVQFKQEVYYKSTREIQLGKELRYALGFGLPLTKEIPFNQLVAVSEELSGFACTDCPGRFATAAKLSEHRSSLRHVHDPEKGCPRCSFVAISKRALTLHLVRVHEQRTEDIHFDCRQCGKSFRRLHHRNRHELVTHAEHHKCTLCPKQYRERSGLAQHCEKVHSQVIMPKDFECPVCHEQFYGYEQMANHRLIAHRDGYYDKVLRRQTEYRKKNMAKTEDTFKVPPPPPTMNGPSTSAAAVDPSMPSTSAAVGPTKHSCRFCEMHYMRPQARSRHERSKHREQYEEAQLAVEEQRRGEFQFVCEYCSRRFERAPQLVDHTRRHIGNFKFRCTHEGCDKGFIKESELRRHVDKTHGVEGTTEGVEVGENPLELTDDPFMLRM